MACDGRFLEKIGIYNPIGKKEINVDLDKAKKWLSEGASMSPAVKSLLKQAGVFSA
jgi:small subunit ribosomal protein S16